MERRRRTIGHAIDECIKLSTEEWFRQHAGQRSREEAFAEDVKHVTTSSERYPGGRLAVQVGIVTRRRSQQQLDYYAFEVQGSAGYVQVRKLSA